MKRSDIDKAIAALDSAYYHGAPWADSLYETKSQAVKLKTLYDWGEGLEVAPGNLPGQYVTRYWTDKERAKSNSHSSLQSVADLAKLLDKPVLIEGWMKAWAENVDRKLTLLGVTVVMEG